jgi:hypothetical protein
MDDLSRLQLDDEKRKKRTEEEISDLEEITGPYVFCMMAQERSPILSSRLWGANGPHILLNCAFTHPNIQLEQLATNALSSPEAIVCCHFLNQSDCLGRKPRLSRMRLRFALPEHTEELTMPAKQRLWLDKEERLFPGSDYPGQKHQEKPIPFPVDRSFDLATKDDQLLS